MKQWALTVLCACGATPAVQPSDAGADVHDARACSTQPSTIAQGSPSPRIAVDDTDVYWVDYGATQSYGLERTPKTGGQTFELATNVMAFAVDANAVYYCTFTFADGGTTSTLYALAKTDGGAATVLTPSCTGVGVAVDATNVYFVDGAIKSVPKSGGAAQVIASAHGLVGVDDASVYWIDGTTIGSTAKIGGASVQLLQTQAAIRSAVLDAGDIYFTTDNRDLTKLTIATTTVTTLASALGQSGGFNLAVRSGFVFVDQQDIGQYPAVILAVPTSGGAAQDTCAGGSMSISGLAVDDTAIYWGLIYEASGQVLRMPR